MKKIKAPFLANLVLLLVFLLPLQTRLIISRAPLGTGTSEYGTISIYAIEVLLWATFILFWLSGRVKYPTDIGGRRLILALFVFLTYSFLGIFFNPSFYHGFFSWLHVLDGFLLFVLLAWGGVKNKWLIASFISGVALEACIGIVQFSIQGISPSTLFGIARHDPAFLGDAVVETTAGRWLRAYGGLPHPNILGGYLVTALMFLGTAALWRKFRGSVEVAMLFGLLVISAALFFTFSRGAWIALGIGGVIFLWNAFLRNGDERFHRLVRFGLPIALLWLVLGLTFVPLLKTRFEGLSKPIGEAGRLEEQSRSERIGEYFEAAELLPKYFLTGTGIGAYAKRLEELNPGQPGYAYQPVHNSYLLLGMELGFPAIILFAGLLFVFVMAIPQKNRWAVAPPLTALLVLGFFDHYFWSLEAGKVLFWAVLGLLYNFKVDEV